MGLYHLHGRRRFGAKIAAAGIILLILGSGAAFALFRHQATPAVSHTAPQTSESVPAAPAAQTVTGRYLFNGTIFWGRGIEYYSRQNGTLNYALPFSQLSTFHPEQYDAWSADLECPTSMHDIPYQVQVDNLKFNCKPEFLPEAAKYFQLINLANNHSGDQGYGPFDETRAALKKNNIQYFGHPDPAQTHETCEVIALPVRISKSDGSEQKAQLPVAFCAWHYFFRKPEPGEIETMRRYAEVMPVFAFVHMGTEYQASASSAQRDIAHAVIDNGASFVIANNPHWVQDSEAYKGKLIVYSTGNFIFDQQPLGRESTRSVSIDTTIPLKYDNNVQRWLDLGPSCVTYQDDCLAKAEAQALQKPQLSFRYTAVAGDSAGVFTRRADAMLQASVEERLGWTQTLKGLTQ